MDREIRFTLRAFAADCVNSWRRLHDRPSFASAALGSRQSRRLEAELLEPRTMLAVTASVTGSELLINLSARHDVAEIQVEGGEYKVRSGTVSAGGFPLAAVDSIRIHGDASLDGQAVYVKPGGTIADPLTINAGVESAVIHAPIVTAGSVTIR